MTILDRLRRWLIVHPRTYTVLRWSEPVLWAALVVLFIVASSDTLADVIVKGLAMLVGMLAADWWYKARVEK